VKQIQQNYRTGELKVAEVPVPQAGKGSLLIATRVSLISSGTEKQALELAKASLAGKAVARPDLVRRVVRNVQRDGLAPTIEKVFTKLDTPIPLGYSVAGEVLELGRHVSGYAVGDRVACAGSGMANHAEINAVPKNLVVRIPAGVTDEDASFVTLGAIALQGVRQAAPTLGEAVVVMGLGLIGQLTVQLLKANGCRVLGFDPNPERAKLAKELGADLAVSEGLRNAAAEFTSGYGADGVVVTASTKSNEPINLAAEISRLKGRVVLVGLVGMAIDRELFYKRELDLKLSMSYGPGRHDPAYEISGHDYPLPYVRWTEQRNMSAFLELVAEGKVTPQKLVTHRFPIEEAERAYELLDREEPHLAVLLTFSREAACKIERRIPLHGRAIEPGAGNVAFIGLGNYAKGMLLPALKKIRGVNLTTVVTSTGISAGHAGEKHGFAVVATDPAAAIEDDVTDTVFIATRHDTHAGLAASALKAGKHVFCEKPLAMSDAELNQTLEAAATSNGVLTVGFNRRFAPMLVQVKEALTPRAGPLVMLYRVNAGAIPRDNWVQTDEGGGRIIGEVCHFVDALIYLTDSLPMEISAQSARDHDDAVSIVIKFADGSTGTIVYTSLGDSSVPKEYLEVFGAGRVAQLDDFRRLTLSKEGRQTVTKGAQDKGQTALVSAFMNAVRNGSQMPIPLEELAAVTEATFAIEEALRTGAVVALSTRV
jgi:predicted dehydrogenase/threonine dehydrogenase-like Zn-dependent dehydrogenase